MPRTKDAIAREVRSLLSNMTVREKASLLYGRRFWYVTGRETGEPLPEIMVTDGPSGLRKQCGKADMIGLNESVPSIAYPTGSALASSWDPTLLFSVGEALAEDCIREDVAVLLGPAVNHKRDPLCGRNFEYYSEDPVLTADLGTAMVQGIQSKGVGACVKHFACNSQEDARFFWHEDLKAGFEPWLAKLEHVIFIRGLGTMGDKGRRLEALCGWLAEKCAPELQKACMRAGRLAKADLVSGMVGEFDTLQGIMGGIYAAKWGEDEVIATALKEQYLPAGPDSPLPESLAGALLAIADKADTMAGCFGLNLIPSGTADPNGLRRCAIGIIRILRKFGFALDVRELFARAQMGYGEREWKLDPMQCLDKLDDFFQTRVRSFYQGLGINTLLVDAALGAKCSTVKGVDERVEALVRFSAEEGYASSVQTFKRVANIVAKQVGEGAEIPATWKKSLLQEEAEQALSKVLTEALPILDHLWEDHNYAGILAQLYTLRPHLDNFFDHVMVACEDAELRANRLAMLKSLSDRFSRVADFAALQI